MDRDFDINLSSANNYCDNDAVLIYKKKKT